MIKIQRMIHSMNLFMYFHFEDKINEYILKVTNAKKNYI